ncbi:membrane-bound lytic murein transglycosylase B [Rhodococcus sp. SMB37]|uniref:hypothetical protein n=1 Tax=Rhodococcus sp. SMB37 TaxID=2512213 RepID=UPI00105305C1|nr:hypothetical protein [Rhodococcus sp. SMB37]TCN55070.1 membrane-bound lytic murein transglycosylase B [Rhodococcus sp. SMB37]
MRWQTTLVVPLLAAAGFAATASAPAPSGASADPVPAQTAAVREVGILPAEPAAPQAMRSPSAATEDPADPLSQAPPAMPGDGFAILGDGPLAIPELVFYAYRAAEMQLAINSPECGLPWHLLAAIGRLESNHADNGHTDVLGTLTTPRTTPDGRVGPMQLPAGAWERFPSDGNVDGVTDPQNVFDATLAAGAWACADGASARDEAGEARVAAMFDSSPEYLANVRTWSAAYKKGAEVAPAVPAVPPTTVPTPAAVPIPTADAAAPAEQNTTEEPASGDIDPELPMMTIPELPDIPCLVPTLCGQ